LFARNGNASFDNILIRGDDIAYAGGGTPQLAAVAAQPMTDIAAVTADDLAAIAAAARELWTSALGAGDSRLAILDQVSILLADLPDGMLGATTGTTIVIDSSAAGWGWFVDQTPGDNSEFRTHLSSVAFLANPDSPAYGRIDLLSTVLHEMGNAMGFAEDLGQDVTGMVLSSGERRVPEHSLSVIATESVAQQHANVESIVQQHANVESIVQHANVESGASVRDQARSITVAALADMAPVPSFGPAVATVAQTISTGLDGTVLASGILPGKRPESQAGNTAAADASVLSFVSLGASLSVNLGETNGKSQAAAGVDEASAAEHRSARASDATKAAPAIKWNGDADTSDRLSSGPADSSPAWLDDFLNHLGQNETQRNPNAGLRVRPVSSVHAA
jgi:hypothetical protein